VEVPIGIQGKAPLGGLWGKSPESWWYSANYTTTRCGTKVSRDDRPAECRCGLWRFSM